MRPITPKEAAMLDQQEVKELEHQLWVIDGRIKQNYVGLTSDKEKLRINCDKQLSERLVRWITEAYQAQGWNIEATRCYMSSTTQFVIFAEQDEKLYIPSNLKPLKRRKIRQLDLGDKYGDTNPATTTEIKHTKDYK